MIYYLYLCKINLKYKLPEKKNFNNDKRRKTSRIYE